MKKINLTKQEHNNLIKSIKRNWRTDVRYYVEGESFYLKFKTSWPFLIIQILLAPFNIIKVLLWEGLSSMPEIMEELKDISELWEDTELRFSIARLEGVTEAKEQWKEIFKRELEK